MSAASFRLPLALPRVARVERGRALAGVCAGVGESVGVDPTLVRLAFAFLAFASGAGIAAYAGAWALLPAPGATGTTRRRKVFGVACLLAAVQLSLRGLGLADSLVWPLALAAAGCLLWLRGESVGLTRKASHILAAILFVLGVAGFLGGNTKGTATTLLAPGAVAVALLLVLGPWAWRLLRERDTERDARVRSEERAEIAARVHDSVLQTLALIQRDPSDPRRVSTLARRQERELRSWLYPDREVATDETLASALESALAEVEELHGVRVELVRTGDAPLDDAARALVLAAREATTNAAKHSGCEEISVFLDATGDDVALYVRDRGRGFDPDTVPGDRRGIAESIRARMERAGGAATITSAPDEGTEVELVLRRER